MTVILTAISAEARKIQKMTRNLIATRPLETDSTKADRRMKKPVLAAISAEAQG